MPLNFISFLFFSYKVLIGGLEYDWDVIARFVLPQESLRIQIISNSPSEFGWIFSEGELIDISKEEKIWVAPLFKGLYQLTITSKEKSTTIHLLVMKPFSELKSGRLGNCYIGKYPTRSPHPQLQSVRGFIEVERDLLELPVSPHYKLGDFLCPSQKSYPKWLVLREELIYKLEKFTELLKEKNYLKTRLSIASGFRTPSKNYRGGGGRYSAHIYGGACDVFVDEDRNGIIDDLNKDGKCDSRDSKILFEIAQELDKNPRIAGGLGWYRRRKGRRGPFVHIDVRGEIVRWRK